jgi:hypothetical protein
LFQMTMATDEVTERLSASRTPIREPTPSDISSPTAHGAAKLAILLCRAELGALLQEVSSRCRPPLVATPHSSP